MWGTRPVSVKTSIRMTLLSLLLVVVGTSLISHEFLRRRDAVEAGRARSLVFAQTIAQGFAWGRIGSGEDLQDACHKLFDFPHVLGVALWDRSGRPLAQAAVAPALSDLLNDHGAGRQVATAVQRIQLPHDVTVSQGPVHLIQVSLVRRFGAEGPAYMTLLSQLDPTLVGSGRHHYAFHVPVIVAALLCLLLGSWWLRREVIRPIRSLVDAANSNGGDDSSSDEFGRYQELGQIARAMSSLQGELGEWRQKVSVIERRVDSRIAEETQRITCDLKRIRHEAWRDPLTRTRNRRFLEEKFPEIFSAQRSSGRDLSVVMLDLDNFKVLNDTVGHAAGDDVLRFVGELLGQCLRGDDFAVRYGGDEFVLILPGVSVENAHSIAGRILAMFTQRARMMVTLRPAPSLTAGIASIVNNNATSPTELLSLADQGLLKAKRSGKRKAYISSARGNGGGNTSAQRPLVASTSAASNL